jgi:hypothetical protein
MGGVGDWLSEQFGSKNEFVSKAPDVERDDYYWGGDRKKADEEIAAARQRQGERIDTTGADQYAHFGMQSRQGAAEVAEAMRLRATGYAPSIAQMQADRQMQQATAAQAAQAASARGGAALALAQQNAANNIANAQGAISNQAQINAAQEQLAAESAAMGAFGQLRSGDLASQQQAAQQALSQAQLNQQQRAMNDQAWLTIRNAQMQGGAQYNQQRGTDQRGSDAINAGVASGNAQMAQGNAMGLMQGIADVAGQAATMGMGGPGGAAAGGGNASGLAGLLAKKAEGGPVTTGTPYIVGERGPELIVPREPGTVIPAEQTREIMSSSLARMSGPAMRTPLAPNEAPAKARTLSDEELQARARAIIEGFRAGMGER